MEDKRVPHPKTKNSMSAKEEAFDAIFAIRNEWAINSNSTEDQERLYALFDMAMESIDQQFVAGGSHPPPPPPRVRQR